VGGRRAGFVDVGACKNRAERVEELALVRREMAEGAGERGGRRRRGSGGSGGGGVGCCRHRWRCWAADVGRGGGLGGACSHVNDHVLPTCSHLQTARVGLGRLAAAVVLNGDDVLAVAHDGKPGMVSIALEPLPCSAAPSAIPATPAPATPAPAPAAPSPSDRLGSARRAQARGLLPARKRHTFRSRCASRPFIQEKKNK
jgi:hypothetical protein